MLSRRRLTALVAVAALAGGIVAHVRLYNPSNGKQLYWSGPGNIPIMIDPVGAALVPDQSDAAAIRLAMRAWNEDPGTKANLVETSYTPMNACVDWLDSSLHLVFFDGTNCSGFFPGGASAVAVTPVQFNSKGRIVDADVIFNEGGFDFTTSGTPGDFDVQDVGTHELGHLLGLDHSGWAGATMYPYVDQNLIVQRSLSADDVLGLRDAYPEGSHGRINGTVRRLSDNSGVAGAHVFAVDSNGRSAAGALTDDSGSFSLEGLDADTYSVEANPLDGTTTAGNLQAGRTIETDFEATVGPGVVVAAGETVSAPDLLVGSDVGLMLGTAFDDLPLEAPAGASTGFALTGSGLAPGSTLSANDPNVVVGGVLWGNTIVNFTVTVLASAEPGHVDLIVENGADRDVLVAGIEILPPTPTVTGVAPAKGNDIGGTAVTITGTGFRSGARVIIGETIYYDGETCTVVDPNTITLTTVGSSSGTFDVVVQDASGVEGRDTSAFQVAQIPVLTSSFPTVGAAAGGTELTIAGDNFQPGMSVRIDGVLQSTVALEGTSTVRVTTDAGAAGGPYVLELENTSGETATSAFSYVAQADPVLTDVAPGSGAPAGGKVITLTGSGFTANSTVQFGVDPITGAGGTAAGGVVLVDANTLQVTTPALAAGRVAVMVLDGVTGQASILPDAYRAVSGGGGGGGGGCYAVPFDGPLGGGRPNPFPGAAWLLLAMGLAYGYAQTVRRRALARLEVRRTPHPGRRPMR